MLIDNGSGILKSGTVEWPGGPGIFESTSVADDQVVRLMRLGGDGITFIPVGADAVGNAVVEFSLDKAPIRLDMDSGTDVYADVSTRRYSP